VLNANVRTAAKAAVWRMNDRFIALDY